MGRDLLFYLFRLDCLPDFSISRAVPAGASWRRDVGARFFTLVPTDSSAGQKPEHSRVSFDDRNYPLNHSSHGLDGKDGFE